MHKNIEKLKFIKNKINEIIVEKQLKTNPQIIVITKTFPIENIFPLLESGHVHYGENKIQEAENKWVTIRKKYKNLSLHMVGKLQSNKAKKAVDLFDYIHSLDNEKLAKALSSHEKKINKKLKYFIQVNIGNEDQKSGISINQLNDFYHFCNQLNLNIIGLMCIPPFDQNPEGYFKEMQSLKEKLNLKELSMGMSSDYLQAVDYSSTYLRIGSSIFGERF